MKTTIGILCLLIILQSAPVFAVPSIERFNIDYIYPKNIQISWAVNDERGLDRVEIFKDSKLVFKLKINGTHNSDTYQTSDDDSDHLYDFYVYDISNTSSKRSKIKGEDRFIPSIDFVSPYTNSRSVFFTTNEKTHCRIGLDLDHMLPVNDQFEINHTSEFTLNQGLNYLFVTCEDFQDNKNSTRIQVIYDTTTPSKIGNVTKTNLVLTWPAATDSNGISHYNIYSDIKLITTTKTNSWTINTEDDLIYIAAVDNAGNEGEKTEYNLGRQNLLTKNVSEKPVITTEVKTIVETEPIKEPTPKKEMSSTTKIAWAIFAVLFIIYLIWKLIENRTDKHGLNKYISKRRKIRDLDVRRHHE